MLDIVLSLIHSITVGWTIFISTLILLVGLIFNIYNHKGLFTLYTWVSIIVAGIVLGTIPFDHYFIRQVPTVTQVNYIYAREELNKIDLEVITNISNPDETYQVISQNKKPGKLVLKGTPIELILDKVEITTEDVAGEELLSLTNQGVPFTDLAFALENHRMTITEYDEDNHETKELYSLGYPIYDYSGIKIYLTREADAYANSFTFTPELDFIDNYNAIDERNVIVKGIPFGIYNVTIKINGFEDRLSQGLLINDRIYQHGNRVTFRMTEKNASLYAPIRIRLYGAILNEYRNIYYSIYLKDGENGLGNVLLKDNHEIEISSYSHVQFMLSLLLGDKEIRGSEYFTIEHAGEDIFLYVTDDTITQTNFESYLNYTDAR